MAAPFSASAAQARTEEKMPMAALLVGFADKGNIAAQDFPLRRPPEGLRA
jgi:hypothetical protein